jgi:hypothetical protein
MNDTRLSMVANCVRVLEELIQPGELARIEIGLSDPEAIVLTILLPPRDEFAIELYMESSDNPLDAAVTVFDYVQEHLAEEGPARGEARPACRPGHAHPASCRRQEDAVVLVCPRDSGVLRTIV